MIKNYKVNNLKQIFTLGLKIYGAKIENELLILKYTFFPKKLRVDDIVSINYEIRRRCSYYIIADVNGKEFLLMWNFFEGHVSQDLFNDLKKINPKIKFSDEIIKFLALDLSYNTFHFDFKYHKGEFLNKDNEFSQKYPSLDALVGLTFIIILFGLPIFFGIIGNKILINNIGINYAGYHLVGFILGGLFLSFALLNIIQALFSMYLGHKVTIIVFMLSLICFCIGLLN